jgi:hypothetical protein
MIAFLKNFKDQFHFTKEQKQNEEQRNIPLLSESKKICFKLLCTLFVLLLDRTHCQELLSIKTKLRE